MLAITPRVIATAPTIPTTFSVVIPVEVSVGVVVVVVVGVLVTAIEVPCEAMASFATDFPVQTLVNSIFKMLAPMAVVLATTIAEPLNHAGRLDINAPFIASTFSSIFAFNSIIFLSASDICGVIPSTSPNAPFAIKSAAISNFPPDIRLAIKLAWSSREPFPVIRTSTCSVGKSLTRFIASLSIETSSSPNCFLIPSANVDI